MFFIKGTGKTDGTRINDEIRAREVRLISEEGEQLGLMSFHEAYDIAQEKNLDLVEMSSNNGVSVCKIMDYGKYRYEKLKKDKENKKKQKNTVIKEIRVKPHIDTHDMETKINQIDKFLEKENKVKISLRLSGREKLHSETAVKVLDEFANVFEDKAIVEKKYGKEQLQKFVMLSPKK
ncbi:translation initiation factor IF-3 [Streptobacillus felis]|uniref:Translation initiation factor IF-3 n=1 Tax=Streptobacillus felis TaxID=1384509 RepID=A0A7Z0TAT8_9FUSO|nr:translation initiation factor IF-3 [Streptobacillus felis]NYV28355.1 translation initiation factor IF-3 [Streptobacillus felis]